MIEFKEVEKKFKVDFWAKPFIALDNVSFTVLPSKITGFLGANGAGKTTSIKSIFKFIPIDSGEINYSSELGQNFKEVLSNIGYVPERPYFYPHLTGEEFVTYMGKLQDMKVPDIRSQMMKWAERFKIDHALSRKIHGYSKGMLQRLGFVTALIHNPQMIILDEPLSGLDPVGRKEIKEAMLELNKIGKTIFFSSHIVSDVEEVCSEVVVLEKGKNLYSGPIDNLIEKNNKSEFKLTYKLPDGRIEIVKESELKKKDLLEKTLSSGYEILSMNPLRPSLEEIVYNIRK